MKKMLRIVPVLGVPYTITEGNVEDFPNLENCDGYCDTSTKEIVICDMLRAEGEPGAKGDMARYKRKVIRHELTHAALFESGLSINSWAENEEVVDWIAIQFPKLTAMFEQAGCDDILKDGD